MVDNAIVLPLVAVKHDCHLHVALQFLVIDVDADRPTIRCGTWRRNMVEWWYWLPDNGGVRVGNLFNERRASPRRRNITLKLGKTEAKAHEVAF